MLKHVPTAVLAVAVLAAIPAPAEASIFGSTVAHASPDDGYDAALIVRCDGTTRRIAEGQSSDDACVDEDVTAVYVRSDEEWWKRTTRRGHSTFTKAFDATGWHAFSGNGAYVLHRD